MIAAIVVFTLINFVLVWGIVGTVRFAFGMRPAGPVWLQEFLTPMYCMILIVSGLGLNILFFLLLVGVH